MLTLEQAVTEALARGHPLSLVEVVVEVVAEVVASPRMVQSALFGLVATGAVVADVDPVSGQVVYRMGRYP